MDTQAVIAQLMQVERLPQVRIQQRELIEEARKAALTDVRTRVENLSSKIETLRNPASWGDVQTVESSQTSLVATRTGGAAAGAYSVTVRKLASADQISQQNAGFTTATSADKLTIAVGSQSVTVNISAGDDVEQIATRINSSSNVPVYATVLDGKLVLSGKTTGAGATISVSDGDLTNGYDVKDALFGAAPLTHKNADAEISLDDGSSWVNRASNTVTDLIAGVSLTLKGTTTGAATVTVSEPKPDEAAIKKTIEEFVTQYNSTIDFIRSKLEEKKVADPQSTVDRMKGVLAGDAGLTSMLSQLRRAVTDEFDGNPTFEQLADAGLSTGKTTGSGTLDQTSIEGRLKLDAESLTSALAKNFDGVKQLFTNATGVAATEGLAQRLDRVVDPWIEGDGTNGAILDARITGVDDLIASLKERSAALDVRLATREQTLRQTFTMMETALAQANAQGSWLSAQIAQL
jgi:flagellar hook-associated protein 2